MVQKWKSNTETPQRTPQRCLSSVPVWGALFTCMNTNHKYHRRETKRNGAWGSWGPASAPQPGICLATGGGGDLRGPPPKIFAQPRDPEMSNPQGIEWRWCKSQKKKAKIFFQRLWRRPSPKISHPHGGRGRVVDTHPPTISEITPPPDQGKHSSIVEISVTRFFGGRKSRNFFLGVSRVFL